MIWLPGRLKSNYEMVDAKTIKQTILTLGNQRKGAPVTLAEVAKTLDLANWEEIIESVRLVAEVMELQGIITVKADVIDYAGKLKRDQKP